MKLYLTEILKTANLAGFAEQGGDSQQAQFAAMPQPMNNQMMAPPQQPMQQPGLAPAPSANQLMLPQMGMGQPINLQNPGFKPVI